MMTTTSFYWMIFVFMLMTTINVILNTARTIITVKGGTFISAISSAIAFGFYTVFTVYIVTTPLDNLTKGIVTAVVNFVGVYIVKCAEEWIRKDKLWVINVVIYAKHLSETKKYLNKNEIQFTETPIVNSDSKMFVIYSLTQDDSRKVRDILDGFGAKYFVTESKYL